MLWLDPVDDFLVAEDLLRGQVIIFAAHRRLMIFQSCAALVDIGGEELTFIKLELTASLFVLVFIPGSRFEAWAGEAALNGRMGELVCLWLQFGDIVDQVSKEAFDSGHLRA